MEVFVGTIMAFGFDFAPREWAFCDGSILQIRQNTALFSLLGVYYGGDGKTTFALPNLAGRTAIGFGPANNIGDNGGAAGSKMQLAQMPAHTHGASSTIAVPVYSDGGTLPNPTGNTLAVSPGVSVFTNEDTDVFTAAFNAPGTLLPTGSGTEISTISPYQVLNYSIALTGIFPSRN